MVPGAVAAEVEEDIGEGGMRVWDGEENIEERDDGIIGTRFTAEGLPRGRVCYTFVDDAAREHGLFGDAKDEGAEGVVVAGLGLHPHVWRDAVSSGALDRRND